MNFAAQLIEVIILTTFALLWARWSRLDLGLRTPAMKGVWSWCLLFVAWIAVEAVMLALRPPRMDSEWFQGLEQLSLLEEVLLLVVLGPIEEELLFRGALFSALMRRWGAPVAVAVPSVLWALMHLQYEPWHIASIAGSGVVLAIIRWKSGSLYLPVALHAAVNLIDVLPV